MKNTAFQYSEAIKRLEEIVSNIENEQNIDTLTDQLKEAQGLLKKCKEKLYQVDESVQKILQKEDKN